MVNIVFQESLPLFLGRKGKCVFSFQHFPLLSIPKITQSFRALIAYALEKTMGKEKKIIIFINIISFPFHLSSEAFINFRAIRHMRAHECIVRVKSVVVIQRTTD